MSAAVNGVRTSLVGTRVLANGKLPVQTVIRSLPGETPGKLRWTGPEPGQRNYDIYEKVLDPGGENQRSLPERGIF